MPADYTLEGVKWGASSVDGTAGGDVTWSIGSTFNSEYRQEIQTAFAAWAAVSNIQFTQLADNQAADIDLTSGAIDGVGGVLGETSFSYSAGSLADAQIEFDSGEAWSNTGSGLIESGDYFIAVAMHEIGHAIGMDHYTAATAIMNPYLTPGLRNLTQSDIDGAQAIYGPFPVVTLPVTLPVSNPGIDVYAGTSHLAYGSSGNDTVIGSTGNDLMFGGAGNDFMYAGDGLDTMYGGDGNDVLVGGKDYNLLEGGAGDDYLYVYNGGGLLYGGTGNDVLVGNLSPDVLIGDDGDDVLYSYGGNDYIYGGSGNDTMFGGDGVDVLIGGAGNDYFDGGTGVNYYFGGDGGGPGTGQGIDTFASTAGGVDVIQDWSEGLDSVLLTGTGFSSFKDVLAHSYQNGAYFVTQTSDDSAVWINGATASSLTASDFSIVS